MEKYYTLAKEEVIKKLESSSEGLNDTEVKKRLVKDGLNKLKEIKNKGILYKFLCQFKDLMIIILIIAAILSAVVSIQTGESFTDTIIILFVVFLYQSKPKKKSSYEQL